MFSSETSVLTITLKSEFYELFKNKEKNVEYRKVNHRFNRKECFVGREIFLARGSSPKTDKIACHIRGYIETTTEQLPQHIKNDILKIYGNTAIAVMEIGF